MSFGDESRILVMTKGADGCIFVFMPQVFEEYRMKIKEMKIDKKKKLFQMRKLNEAIEICKIDANWRVKLPDNLVEYAQIEKEVAIRGLFDRIELWNPENHKQYLMEESEEGMHEYDDFVTELFVE
ncbi:MAG: hypothetical protein HQ568_06930 [Calditrichaeota bacterium]|nr:hypothetical protein [Calditrichota bacterium]